MCDAAIISRFFFFATRCCIVDVFLLSSSSSSTASKWLATIATRGAFVWQFARGAASSTVGEMYDKQGVRRRSTKWRHTGRKLLCVLEQSKLRGRTFKKRIYEKDKIERVCCCSFVFVLPASVCVQVSLLEVASLSSSGSLVMLANHNIIKHICQELLCVLFLLPYSCVHFCA
jgi:hypothetical protein